MKGVHAGTFVEVLKVPAGHTGHCRSAVLEPGEVVETCCPAPQLLHGAQALAGFMSWSQEPVAQAPPGFVPPGQYQPMAQAAHVAGIVLVAGAVWRVPPAHCPAGTHWAAFSELV
jgi:hypothetical protein